MAAGINDKFKKVSADNSYAVATTVKTARTVGGGTTLEAFDLSKWADATAVNFLTYRKTTDPVTNITTVTNRTGWTALVNTGSNTLTNLTIAPGYTDLGHQVGDYIEPVQMSKWANDLVDGILVTHNQDGTLKNKVATLGKINGGSTDGVLLTDASGNVTGGKVTTPKLDDGAVTSTKLAEAFFRGRKQEVPSSNVTNSAPTGLSVQHGWNRAYAGSGGTTKQQTVTFPVAFSAPPVVFISYLGYKNGNPAAITEFVIGKQDVLPSTASITATNFEAVLYKASSFTSGDYHGFAWMAIGPVA